MIKEKIEQSAYVKQVDLVYQSLPISLLTTAIVVTLLVVFLRDSVDMGCLTVLSSWMIAGRILRKWI